MKNSSPAPKLSLWIFFATDLVLIAAAVWLARRSPVPMPQGTTAAVAACLVTGAIVICVPLVLMYERQKNEALDDRQRALEALAQTVSSSAEQISIAANGLNGIAEISQRQLRQAEQLPHKLQEKIAEFQAQLSNANDAERDELEKEVQELRAAETDRLQSAADRIGKTVAEFTKLEAATQQHLEAANDALSKLSFGAASAIGKAQVAAEQALAQARIEAARVVGQSSGEAVQSIEAARTAALAALSAAVDGHIQRLSAATAGLTDLAADLKAAEQQLRDTIRTRLAEPPAAGSAHAPISENAPASVASGVTAALESDSTPASAAENAEGSPPSAATPGEAASEPGSPSAEALASPPSTPRRTRRSRREPVENPSVVTPAEPGAPAAATAAEPPTENASSAPAPQTTAEAATPAAQSPSEAPVASPVPPSPEPAPVQPEAEAEETPISPAIPETAAEPLEATLAPNENEPPEAFPEAAPEVSAPAAEHSAYDAASTDTNPDVDMAATDSPSRGRKRGRGAEDDQPDLGLDLGDVSGGRPVTVERVLSSDGATRLIVTAYIGIGNRLFIRGDGAGLSWEKGSPLQFVSIGKWRWETDDASAPLTVKLLKNDQVEASGVGALTIVPGHQHEVSVNF
jgi:hypothetical protein